MAFGNPLLYGYGSAGFGPSASTGGGGGGSALPLAGILGGGLLGALGSSNRGNTKEINRMFGPQALSGDIMAIYNMLSQGPQFRQMLSQNMVNASQFEHSLRGNLAQRGLTSTGIGSIATSAGQSAGAFGEQALRGGLFGTAADVAQQNLLARLQAYMQQQQMKGPGFLEQLGGSLASAGGLLALL